MASIFELISAVVNAAAAKLRPVPGLTLPTLSSVQQHTNPAKNVRRQLRRQAKAARVSASQQAKPVKQRKHKQHRHPLRDADGAFTLVGKRALIDERRVWVAGESARAK